MRLVVCALWAAIGLAASPAFADEARDAAAFWKGVQAHCDVTAKKPATDLGERIAQSAIDEFYGFGGPEIDANGRIFHFGLAEAEHHEGDGGAAQSGSRELGWWRVMKYWSALY